MWVWGRCWGQHETQPVSAARGPMLLSRIDAQEFHERKNTHRSEIVDHHTLILLEQVGVSHRASTQKDDGTAPENTVGLRTVAGVQVKLTGSVFERFVGSKPQKRMHTLVW